MKFGWIVL